MIWGIIYNDPSRNVAEDAFQSMSHFHDGITGNVKLLHEKNVAVGCTSFKQKGKEKAQPAANKDRSIIVTFQGNIYNTAEIVESDWYRRHKNRPAALVLQLYEKYGKEFIQRLNGKFAFVIIDRRQNKVILGRDRFGIEPLFYFIDGEKIIFSSTLKSIACHPEVKKEFNVHALCQFLMFCYNPALYTLYRNILKLRPGHLLIHNENATVVEPYWRLSFAKVIEKTEREFCDDLLYLMKDAVRIRIDESLDKGVFLSGGMDSSTIVALTCSLSENRLNTFSFRCKGQSFDESHYAQLVADYYQTIHQLVEYSPEDVERIAEIVKFMDEPFCDVGINIATYLLGKAAENSVNCIYSGDGGDELYGGHPVYVADKTSQLIDTIPSAMLKPFLKIGLLLPDSDKKKNFVVKAKRFSESYSFPKALLSHRWRIYYQPHELQKLIHKDFLSQLNSFDPYQVILRFNKEADGSDLLSRSIYSDYNTVVGFYLRRMGLLKHFGIDARFPMLDHRLVEYAATIPSQLKIKKYSDTKYIFKKTMETTLPHEIVYRKDKLGHSIPLKNWMRDNEIVKTFITDMLSESVIQKRGFFNYDVISRMIDEHMSKTKNNSHRLWALVVLELWLRENL